MRSRAIEAIMRKDMQAITSNFQVWGPMLILPVVFVVILPAVLMIAVSRADFATLSNSDLQQVLRMIEGLGSGSLKQALDALPGPNHQVAYVAGNYMFAPFFLMLPLMAASSVSAQSFAGEKERGTLEGLLFAPLDVRSLFLGKILGAFVPAVGLSVASFVIYAVVVNALGWPMFGGLFFPQWNWLPLMLLVMPTASLATILFSVYVSARVASFQAAYQMSGLVVLPVLLLVVSQVTGLLMLDAWVMTALGAVLGGVCAVSLVVLGRKLSRSDLFESQVR